MGGSRVNNPDEVVISVREIKDKPGKPIVIVFDTCKLLSDVRCMEQGKNTCDKCGIRFKCFTGNNLEINFVKELRCVATDMFEATLSEVIKHYLDTNRVATKKS